MKINDTFNDINYCQDCGSAWIDCVCISDTWIGKRIKENLASGDEEFKSAWMEEVKIDALHKQIDRVSKYAWITHEGWYYPTPQTIMRAKDLADEIVIHLGDKCTYPLTSPHGDIVFEWWNGNDKLTLYVSENNLMAIRTSPDEISDNEYSSISDCVSEEFAWITREQSGKI